MSILIVEDDETNLLIIENILREAGYRKLLKAVSVSDMFRLLDIAAMNSAGMTINLILMDISIGDTDGIEAMKRIHGEERFHDIPVIFVTDIGDFDKLADALDAGVSDYIKKPVNKIELLARIRTAVKLKFQKDRHKEHDRRIKFELELAKRVQQNVLNEPIDDENVHIQGVCQPSFELAGDFYAWYQIDQHRYGVILLDMMGHGISSSLVCMFISSVLQDTIRQLVDPIYVMKELNRYMNQLDMSDDLSNYYFTAIYALLDVEKRTIEYVNAGHPPGVAYIDGQVHSMTKGCCAIGFFEHIDVEKESICYTDGFKMVLFTDGLLDLNYKDDPRALDLLTTDLIQCKHFEFSELIAKFIPDKTVVDQHDDICLVWVTSKSM